MKISEMVPGAEHPELTWRDFTSTLLLLFCWSLLCNAQDTSDRDQFGECCGHKGSIGCSCQESTSGKIYFPAGMKQFGMGNGSLLKCMVLERSHGCYFQARCCVKIPRISIECSLQLFSTNMKNLPLFCQCHHTLNPQISTKECLRQTHQLITGKFCTIQYLNNVNEEWLPGHYCKTGSVSPQLHTCPGSVSSRAFICPTGFQCPPGSASPQSCPAGQFTSRMGEPSCEVCPAGFYCLPVTFSARAKQNYYRKCPAGYYCLPGTCPAGTYSNHRGLSKVEQCNICPAGFYCDAEGGTSTTGPCAPGYYCQRGVNVPQPTISFRNVTDESTFSGHTGSGGICPKGHFCPLGSSTPLPCPVGKYQDAPGQSSCKSCPPGHHCPKGGAEPIPCPVGTYNPSKRAGNVESCLRCPINYFNHLTGQVACFTCGSQAVQPEEGRNRCICLQSDQIFQPSDSQCVCAARHQMVSERTRECVRKLYDICREGASRNQDGACLTMKEWEGYCSLKVCSSPADYQGFDGDLGLCRCRVAALDSVCNGQCRRFQRRALQAVCNREPALRITYRNDLKVDMPLNHIRRILNIRNVLEQSQCQTHRNVIQPVYLVEMSEKGFLGVYDPDPIKLRSLLEMNLDQDPSLELKMSAENATRHMTSASPKDPETPESGVQQLFVNSTLFSGIFNPTACFQTGSIVLFTVISEYYPVYDSANLYNTDSDFDWGAFRDLEEEMELASSSSWLFTYRFNQPGVHVFQMSSNPNKKMYVQVMPVGGQCYEEGPFFPTTPSSFIRMGIRRAQDLHFKPDWLIISSLLAAVMATVGICAGLMLLFRKSSWPKKVIVTPRYQHLQKAYNFDDYSSKEAAIIAVKKIHRSLQFAEQTAERDENGGRKEDSVSKTREFGNYDEQIDLELFNTNTFYQILLKQSLAVSVRLSQHKEEVKMLYQKITEVTESLREHWMEKTNFAGKHVIKTTDLEEYKKMCCKVRLEIKRRKDIGLVLEEMLAKQQQLFQADWNDRVEHHIAFSVALREVIRLLDHEENSLVHQRDSEQVEALLLQMSGAITKECERLSAWSVLGKGMGAQLVEKENLKVLSKEELIGDDRDHGLLQVDQLTGLLTTSPDVLMLLDNKYTMLVPDNFFLHPQTGRVLPMTGNVCYDTLRSCLLPVTDSATGVVYQSEENLIPYVPYPLCPEASLSQKLQLGSLPHQTDLRLGGPMPDPETGIQVPVIAMTIHLQTSLVCPLGGSYISPITKMVAPIELGALMVCEKTGQMVPIIGIGLNTTTGAVIPLGGVLKSSNKPMFLGDSFTEPLSGRSARISGAYVQDTEVVPHTGGYQALLDGAVLVNEVRILEALKDCKDSMTTRGSGMSSLYQKQRGTLREALDDLMRARRRSWAHIIHTMHNLERQRKEAKELANRGGNVGMIPFATTDLLFPAVVGMYIPDPGGSGLEVPILGVEYDSDTGRLIPIAGTMEDADGRGMIPIALGARSIDPITGETGPVVGARLDAQTKIVVPVIQASRGIMRRKLDGEMVKSLDEELHCRRKHWHHQQQKEEALFIALKDLLQDVTDTKTDCKFTKVEDKVRTVGENVIILQDCAQSEAQRRHAEESNLASLMPTDIIVLLSQVDKEEAEQQMLFLAAAQTILEKLTQFAKKMSQDEARQRGQLRQPWEVTFQQAEEASPIGHPQLKTLLTQEFQENILSRWTDLDMVYIRLEHLRELAEQCALEAKVVLSGDVYCFGDYQLTRSQNAGVFHGPPDSTNQKMLPLIKQLINLLDTGRNIILSPDTLNLISNKGPTASSRPQGGWLPYPEPPGIPERSLTMATDTSVSRSSSPSNDIHAKRQALIRFHIEKQASEAAHLEIALISDEVKQIWKLLEEEQQKREDSERLDQMEKLLRDLLEQHRKSVLALYGQHTVELMEVGLDPNLAMPQNILGMENDIMSGLQLLVTDFQKFYARSKHKQDIPLQSETGECTVEAPVAQRLDTESRLTYHSLETLQSWELSLEALKIVMLEVRKLSRVYKTIDMYSKLQVQNSDQAVSQLLNTQDWPLGEQTALRVGRYLEEEHVRRVSDLLRLQREERKQWIKADEGNEGLCLTEKLVGEDSTPHSNKHSADLQRELALQIKERENLVEEQLQLQEEQIIMEVKTGNGSSDIATVVYDIQLLRHLRQYVLLEQRLKQQQQECREASHNCVKQLLTEDNDGDMKCLYNQAKGQNQALMILKSAAALLELQEKNLQELANSLKSFTSDKCVEVAECMAAELKGFRQRSMKTLQEQLQNINGKRHLEQETRKMALINEIKELEANLAEEEKLEGEMVIQDLLKKKRQQSLWMTQKETKLERGELTHEHRENLDKEHSIRLWLQEKSLQQEIEQIEKDQEVKWKKKKDDGQQRIAERKVEEEQKALASHSLQVRQLLNKATKAFEQMASFTAQNFPVLHLKPRPIFEKNFAKLLLQVPLFKLLTEINKHLKANREAREIPQAKMDHQGTNQSKVKYEEKGRPYIDAVDAEFTCEGNLVPLTPEEISVTELAVYRFGIYIMQRVKRVINAPEINLLLASSLPQNNYTHNAFRNSFFYQHSQNTLFIRRQRLASVGDFSILLMHCLAHLAAGELSDDSDVLFLKFFHQALKCIFKETFFTRLNVSPALCAHEPMDSPWHNLFQTEDCLIVHVDAISDLLNNKLKDPKSLSEFEKEDREIKKDNRASTQSKDQQSGTMNGHQSQTERNKEACFESKSELDLQDVQEKIDDLTVELAVLLDLEQKVQDRAISQRKAFLFKEVEELERELDRKQN